MGNNNIIDPSADRFQCAACDGVFKKKWSHKEALKEKTDLFGDIPLEQCAEICDVCFNKMMPMINNNITNIKDIKVGDHLEMQLENDPKHGYFDWGIVELSDIPRFKREFNKGIYLWRIKL